MIPAVAFQFNILGTPARLAEVEQLVWLLAALLAAALFAWAAWRRTRALEQLLPARLWGVSAPGAGPGRGLLAAGMSTCALALLAVALAQPQCGTRTELAKAFGVDVVVAVDASRSMLARDVRPDRLTRAKLELSQLIDQLRGDRVGIVVFAGDAWVQCPLTTDYAAAKLFLRAIDPEAVSRQGTRIDRALETARELFLAADRAAKSRALILLTDGEDHSGMARAAAAKLAEEGVRIFAVPIGSPQGEPIPIFDANGAVVGYKKDRAGQTVVTRADTALLRDIAERSEGKLVASIEEAGREVAQMEKQEFESRLTVQYEDRFQWFVAPALALLLAAPLVGRGSWRRPRRIGASLCLALAALGAPAQARPLSMKVEEPNVGRGNERWRQGFLTDALSDYEAALRLAPDAPEALYDRGNALMRLGRADEAAAAFREAARKAPRALRADALYNLGVLEAEQGARDRAIRAYTEALITDPAHEDARHNLELLLAQELEQERRQQQGGGGDEDERKQDDQARGGGNQEREQKGGGRPEQKQATGSRQGEKEEERAQAEAARLSEQDAQKLLDALEKSEKALQMWRFNQDERKAEDEAKDW